MSDFLSLGIQSWRSMYNYGLHGSVTSNIEILRIIMQMAALLWHKLLCMKDIPLSGN